MQKLFEINVNQNVDTLRRIVDADIVFTGAPYIMYEQFQLDDNFKTYLEGAMQSQHVFRRELNQHPIKNRSIS